MKVGLIDERPPQRNASHDDFWVLKFTSCSILAGWLAGLLAVLRGRYLGTTLTRCLLFAKP